MPARVAVVHRPSPILAPHPGRQLRADPCRGGIRSLPAFFATTVEIAASIHPGINFDALDQFHLPQPPTPILLFHGTNDTTTPIEVSDTFARAHPNFVTYDRVPNAEHNESWNANPQAYDAALTAFLS